MGLLKTLPSLDDKNFDQLVEEALSLISRVSREWTDHNIHDPGITFIELFAWIAEMQMYQINRVTDKEYEKFLKLVGFIAEDVQPSRVSITFSEIKTNEQYVFMPSGSQVVTITPDEKIVFETEKEIRLVPLKLQSVITLDGPREIDRTEANKEAHIYFAPFGEKASQGAAFELGFDKAFPPVKIALTIFLFEEDLPKVGSHKNEEQGLHPAPTIVWEYLSKPEIWEPLTISKEEDKTYALTQSGQLLFDGPPSMQKENDRYWIRCRLVDGAYEIVPLISRILLNTVTAIQLETVRNVEVGIGSGIPYQKVFLKKIPVVWGLNLDDQFYIDDVLDWSDVIQEWQDETKKSEVSLEEFKSEKIRSLNEKLEGRNLYKVEKYKDVKLPDELRLLLQKIDRISEDELKKLNRFLIEETARLKFSKSRRSESRMILQVRQQGRWEEWLEVNDFENSGPKDQHYILNSKKGEITFGNGLNGRIPLEGENIQARLYRTSLGQNGNVPRGQKFEITLEESQMLIGENFKQATGGRDAESIDEVKGRARKEFGIPVHAVTAADYEQLTKSTPGLRVARTKALMDHHPDFPCTQVPGTVTVVVVPYAREGTVTPVPSASFLQEILDHLNKHRLVTAVVYVVSAEYVEVSIAARIRTMPKSDPTKVIIRVQRAIQKFLDPLKGGPDKNGWQFGRAVYASELYQVIDNVEGVDFARDITLQTGEAPKKDLLKIPPTALVFSGTHEIQPI